MHPIQQADHEFTTAKTPDEQRDALISWLKAAVEVAEQSWPAPGRKGSAGTVLASALVDLQQGYVPRILQQSDVGDRQGKTRGGRANARARAVVAVQIVKEWGWSQGKTIWAVRLVALRNGMGEGALSSLKKHVENGREVEVAALLAGERSKWQDQLEAPGCEHENIFHLVLTELAADRHFFRK